MYFKINVFEIEDEIVSEAKQKRMTYTATRVNQDQDDVEAKSKPELNENPFHGIEVTSDNDIIVNHGLQDFSRGDIVLKMQELTQATPEVCEQILQRNEFDYEKSITDYYASLSLR